MDIREVGDGFVALDGDRALSIEGDAARAYRAGGISRRQMLTRIGAGVAVAGVSYVALPMAAAHASLTNGPLVVTLSPTSGPDGQVIQVTVTNLPTVAGTAITTVTIGATTVIPSNTTVTGGTANFTITVPNGFATGGTTVTVHDNHNNQGSAPFTVTTPTAVPTHPAKHTGGTGTAPGTFTIPTSSGFLPGSTITLSVSAPYTGLTPTTVTATAGGAVPTGTTFTVTYGNGALTGNLTLTDSAGNTVTVPLTTA